MADYQADKTYAVSGEELHGIAEAIRLKRDITDGIPVSDMAMQIGLISGGGVKPPIAKLACGSLEIDSSQVTGIMINHNFGEFPDFVFIKPRYANADLVPYGCCVLGCYSKFTPGPNVTDLHPFLWLYGYKHATSGNILQGTSSFVVSDVTNSTFLCRRGFVNWAVTDTEGNNVVYDWFAIKLG